MQSRTCILSGVTAMFFGGAAIAADMPKEGTFNGIYASYGTYKAFPVGKEMLTSSFEENGLMVGKGLLDHTTWHCWGTYSAAKGMAQFHANCVVNDPDGDQIVVTAADVEGKHPQDAKSYKGLLTLTAGTGKYTGISGSVSAVFHDQEFRSAEGSFVQYGSDVQGSYKLP